MYCHTCTFAERFNVLKKSNMPITELGERTCDGKSSTEGLSGWNKSLVQFATPTKYTQSINFGGWL